MGNWSYVCVSCILSVLGFLSLRGVVLWKKVL
jgi:hypothetical protein